MRNPLPPERETVSFAERPNRTAIRARRAITFVINRKGGYYVGELSLDEIANVLAVAVGPKGSMAEYLYSTAHHLEDAVPWQVALKLQIKRLDGTPLAPLCRWFGKAR